MGNFSPDQINALERLINYTNTAEGSVLPPQLVGGVRIPSVTNLQVAKTVPAVGGSLCTLTWTDVEDGRNLVDHYDVSAIGLLNGNTQPLNLVHSDGSPCNLTIQGDKAQPVVFVVQTVLKNGMTSDISQSPSCGCFCAAPLITTQFVGSGAITGFNIANADFSNLIDNPGFELGDTGSWIPVGHAIGTLPLNSPKVQDSGWQFQNNSSNAHRGNWSVSHVASSYTNDDLTTIGQIQCLAGDQFFLSCWTKATGGADGVPQLVIQFYNAAGTPTANSVLAISSTGSFTQSSFVTTAAGGAGASASVQARIILDVANQTTGTWYFDDIQCTPIVSGAEILWGPQKSITLVNGANNDVAIGSSSYVRIVGPTAAYNITGFQIDGSSSDVDGHPLYLYNSVHQTLTLKHLNAGSNAVNRILIPAETDTALRATGLSVAQFVYSAADTAWILVGTN